MVVSVGNGIEGLFDLEIESVRAKSIKTFLGFGFRLDILDFEDFDVDTFLLDDGVDFPEVLVRVHVLIGVVAFVGLDFDSVYFFL